MSFTPYPVPKAPMTLAQAIARMEGFYAAGQVPNRPQRNCNPGDIEFGELAQQYGAVSGDPRFAIFPSAAHGFACLNALLRSPSYIGLTLQECIARYAPANENDVEKYVGAVCYWTGLTPESVLGMVLSGDSVEHPQAT